MNPADAWSYRGQDDCADFFGACLTMAQIDVPINASVLEIGCAEFDWLTPAHASWPEMSFIGLDWRLKHKGKNETPHISRRRLDVRDPALFPPESFDWVVSISTIEHIGLGHYRFGNDADPLDPEGDTIAIANAMRWLKPGGWLLFDVPYDPSGYDVPSTKYRVYDDGAIFLRLWVEGLARAKARARWRGTWYAKARAPKGLMEKPTEPTTPFYYAGMAWQKVG